MKVLFVISAIVSFASAGVGPLVFIPSSSSILRSSPFDSAIVRSEQLGGNFGYTIAEGQSFQALQPIVASNLRAIDSLGLSYAINPYPIYSAPTILLPQPSSEEQQREQQKQKDLLQRQQDELQEAIDHQREDEERLIQDQIDQQNQYNQQAIDQQKQLFELQQQWQQEQQNLISGAGNGFVTLPIAVAPSVVPSIPSIPSIPSVPSVVPSVPTTVSAEPSDDKPIITDDSVIVENTSLEKEQRVSDETQPEDQPQDEPSDRTTESVSDN